MKKNHLNTNALLKSAVNHMDETREDLNAKVQGLAGGQDSALLQGQQRIMEAFEKREKQREEAFHTRMENIEKKRLKMDGWKIQLNDLLKIFIWLALTVVVVIAVVDGLWNGLFFGSVYDWSMQWWWVQTIVTLIYGVLAFMMMGFPIGFAVKTIEDHS
jgi:ABC-type multidrug transport system fused ATPase/permease subunit